MFLEKRNRTAATHFALAIQLPKEIGFHLPCNLKLKTKKRANHWFAGGFLPK
jgi:hypothetical protein